VSRPSLGAPAGPAVRAGFAAPRILAHWDDDASVSDENAGTVVSVAESKKSFSTTRKETAEHDEKETRRSIRSDNSRAAEILLHREEPPSVKEGSRTENGTVARQNGPNSGNSTEPVDGEHATQVDTAEFTAKPSPNVFDVAELSIFGGDEKSSAARTNRFYFTEVHFCCERGPLCARPDSRGCKKCRPIAVGDRKLEPQTLAVTNVPGESPDNAYRGPLTYVRKCALSRSSPGVEALETGMMVPAADVSRESRHQRATVCHPFLPTKKFTPQGELQKPFYGPPIDDWGIKLWVKYYLARGFSHVFFYVHSREEARPHIPGTSWSFVGFSQMC